MIRICLSSRLTLWRAILALLLVGGFYAGYLRQVHGWGNVEYLRNVFPWGLCGALDVFCGQALTAGAFTVALVLYCLNRPAHRPVLRLSLVAGFVGFLVAILAVSVNRPISVPVALSFWDRHSVAVGMLWSIVLYSVLLVVEFAPDVSRTWRSRVPARATRFIAIPLMVLAWALANLHQVSLANLLGISGAEFSPLWASPRLPMLLFLSAVFGCLAVLMFASFTAQKHFGRALSPVHLRELGQVMGVVLFLYLAVRIADYLERGIGPRLLGFRAENYLLGLELSLLVLSLMMLTHGGLSNPRRLNLSAILAIAGLIANRLNTGITAREAVAGVAYHVHWTEMAIAYGILALGIATFAVAITRLPVLTPGRRTAM